MLNLKFNQFDVTSSEGMLLLSSIAVLTGNIDTQKYGSNKTPDEVFEHIQDLANRIFYEEELKMLEKINKRQKRIDDIL